MGECRVQALRGYIWFHLGRVQDTFLHEPKREYICGPFKGFQGVLAHDWHRKGGWPLVLFCSNNAESRLLFESLCMVIRGVGQQ